MREKAEKLEEERVARGEEPSTKGPQWRPGIAYEGKQLANEHNFHKGVDVYAAPGKVRVASVTAACSDVFITKQTMNSARHKQARERLRVFSSNRYQLLLAGIRIKRRKQSFKGRHGWRTR